MTSVCPAGHTSGTDDWCEVCGAKIGAAAAVSAPVSVPATPPPAATTAATPVPSTGATVDCPGCGQPNPAGDRFCESCGWDFVAGAPAAPAPATAAVAGPAWTAVAEADNAYWTAGGVDVPFPAQCPPRTFQLAGDQVRIGRRSASRGINPEIDLTGPPLDPGISHLHALLTRAPDGGWLLSDPGSTNGTLLNDATEPIPTGAMTPVRDGDRIHLGAWTTITLHAG